MEDDALKGGGTQNVPTLSVSVFLGINPTVGFQHFGKYEKRNESMNGMIHSARVVLFKYLLIRLQLHLYKDKHIQLMLTIHYSTVLTTGLYFQYVHQK